MKTLTFSRNHLSLAAGVLLLAACGGGGGGNNDPLIANTDVPTSATTSSAGAFAFAKNVASNSSNSDEPLVLGDVVLATSETDEPDPSI